MNRTLVLSLGALAALGAVLHAAEFHVATNGLDTNPGTLTAPLRTIQHAADLAQPGDTITVHQGEYRERVNPPRGGDSEGRRIVYRAAPGERVAIRRLKILGNFIRLRNAQLRSPHSEATPKCPGTYPIDGLYRGYTRAIPA